MRLVLLLLLVATTRSLAFSSSSSPAPALFSSSSSLPTSFLSSSSSSSSSSYNGNDAAFPGCYTCPAITQCPTYPDNTTYPAFSLHATTSAAADASACNLITSDILVEVTQHAPTPACAATIGGLACFGAFTQGFNCSQLISPLWPAMCQNGTSCLNADGQAFVEESELCTNIQAFLNRPTAIASSTAGGRLNEGSRVAGSSVAWAVVVVAMALAIFVC